MKIDPDRLWRRIETMAGFTEADRPYTRRSFSAEYSAGREWLAAEFASAGLDVRIDPGGNLVGTRAGGEATLPRLGSGSHTDTVPAGGRYDGIAGVLAALEVAHALDDNEVILKRSFDVIDFLAEEPSNFGLSRVGSRALTGDLAAETLDVESPDGRSLGQAISDAGGDLLRLAKAASADDYTAFVELHIEQGPVLEAQDLSIGIVTDIVGIRRVDLAFTGRADHSGTTPMNLRRDALVSASRVVARLSELAGERPAGDEYVVATVGRLDVSPNGSNVVPGLVELTIEVRSSSDATTHGLVNSICEFAENLAAEADLEFERADVSFSPAASCDADVQAAIEASCEAAGTSYRYMASGAGHDAACMAKCCPSGMIFIPCLGGRSHCPEESITVDDLAVGAQTLYDTILRLDAAMD